ncbi:DUF4406 domain-containing protein [Pseudomonas fluorescens]|uniref:Uncharacterized protein n=2 Tax=Pseudomonas fluorescens TaxID=294 RepID=A0A3M3Y6F2_PSEFL|nr:DUF4406 domain-containing protein [Pseudomonas fluorescens]MCI4607269.1 DUF4406 domain-containing protein [Pseudomonas fluorescens]PQA99934.1 hypothetical protein B0A76_16445 [Pseudomonas fluorescens]RFP96133.1 DUF4406 domain-containing protein [Pseudomonas fluorescens]RMO77263.1 hypothetical protein ALQ35_04962 [Pseudomonas fluorescens]TWR44736.1 DUF4406 domain-containing protein [Pseudomonas fluorescens]
MPTENRKPDIRSIVTDSLVGMIAAVTRTTPPANEPLPSFIQAPVDRAVDRIRSFLLPGVTLQAARANRVYVAGPMTGIEDFNYPAFNAVADQLRAQGYEVENPADHGIVEGAQWADYMAYDLTRLGLCGMIALLPDWEKSQGARLEVLIAERLGMTVVNAHDLLTKNTEGSRAKSDHPPLQSAFT